MGYSSAQFLGRSAALKAFTNVDATNWSVLQGKQFLFKYEGTDPDEGITQLTELLKMIAESSASEAIYTLRWYEYEEPAKTVKGSKQKRKIFYDTPFDGSFNFKLFDDHSEISGRRSSYTDLSEMKKQLADQQLLLQQLIKDRNQEDSEDEKISGITGFINGLMDVPEIKQAIAGKVIQLFNGVTNKVGEYMSGQHPVPAKIAGPEIDPIQMPQDQVTKLNTALTILVKADANFAEHLYKLAMIARDTPDTYGTLITMLNSK
jgi:hypothetical protein